MPDMALDRKISLPAGQKISQVVDVAGAAPSDAAGMRTERRRR